MNTHRRLSYWLCVLGALIIAAVMMYCVIWCGYQICAARAWNPAYGCASPEHGKRHAYHGILFSYWDEERFRWSFERDGKVCKL